MSYKAYKVTKPAELAETATFNLGDWYDSIVMLASCEKEDYLEFEKETIEAEIEEMTKAIGNNAEGNQNLIERLNVLEAILKDIGEGNSVEYECF